MTSAMASRGRSSVVRNALALAFWLACLQSGMIATIASDQIDLIVDTLCKTPDHAVMKNMTRNPALYPAGTIESGGGAQTTIGDYSCVSPLETINVMNCVFPCLAGYYTWSATPNPNIQSSIVPWTWCDWNEAAQIQYNTANPYHGFWDVNLWTPLLVPECRACPAGTTSSQASTINYIAACNKCPIPTPDAPVSANSCSGSILNAGESCTWVCDRGYYSDTGTVATFTCENLNTSYLASTISIAVIPPVKLNATDVASCHPCVFFDEATADPSKAGVAACGKDTACPITHAQVANGDIGSCSSFTVPIGGSCNIRCNQGFYSSQPSLTCSNGEPLFLPVCTPCPNSCTTQNLGSTDSSDCNVCLAPYLQLGDTAPAHSQAGTCGSDVQPGQSCDIQCDAGFYRTGSTFTCGSCGSAVLSQSCTACPSGSSSLPGATSVDDCSLCQANPTDPVVPPGECDLRLIPSSACQSQRQLTFLTCSSLSFPAFTSCWARVEGWAYPWYEEWGCTGDSSTPFLVNAISTADFNVSPVGWYCHYGGCFSSSPVVNLTDSALAATNDYWRRSFPLSQMPSNMSFPTFRFLSNEFKFFMESGLAVALQRNSLGYFKQRVAAVSNPSSDQIKVMTLVESWIQDRLAARSFLHTVIEPAMMQMLNARVAITNVVYDLAEKASLRNFQAEVSDSIDAIRNAIDAMKPSKSVFDIVLSIVSAGIAIASPALAIAEKTGISAISSAVLQAVKSVKDDVGFISDIIKLESALANIDKVIPTRPKQLETNVENVLPDFYASAEDSAAAINAAAGFADFGENATSPSAFIEIMHARHGLGIINSIFRVTQMIIQYNSYPDLAHADSAVSSLFDGIAPQLSNSQAFLSSIANSTASASASEVRREHFIDSILLLQETVQSVFAGLESAVMNHYGFARELAKLHSFDTAAWLDADAVAWTRFLLLTFINDNYSFSLGWNAFFFGCARTQYWFYGMTAVAKNAAPDYYSTDMFPFRQLAKTVFNGTEFSFLYQNPPTTATLPPVIWDDQTDTSTTPEEHRPAARIKSEMLRFAEHFCPERVLDWPKTAIPFHSCMQGNFATNTWSGVPWLMISNSTFLPTAPFVEFEMYNLYAATMYLCHDPRNSPTALTEWYTFDGFPALFITSETITRLEGNGIWNEMLVNGIGPDQKFTTLTPAEELSLRLVVFGSFNLSNLVNADLPSMIVRSRRLIQDTAQSLVPTPPVPDFATVSVDIPAFSLAFASELAVALQLPANSVSVTSVSLVGAYPSLVSYVVFPNSSDASAASVQTQLQKLIADPFSSLYAGPLGHCIINADSAILSVTVTEAALSTGPDPLSVFPSATEANQAVFQPSIMTRVTDSVVQSSKDAAQAAKAAAAAQTSVKNAEQELQLDLYQVCGYETLTASLPTVESPFLISPLVPGTEPDAPTSSVMAIRVESDSVFDYDSSLAAAVVALYPPRFSKREFYLPYLSVEPPLTMHTFSNVTLTKQLTRVWVERVMCRELDGPQWRTADDSAFRELKFGRLTRLLVSPLNTTLVNGWLNFTASNADSRTPLPLGLPVAVASSSAYDEVFVGDLLAHAVVHINTTSNAIDESLVLPFAHPFALALVRNASILYVLSADRNDGSYLYRVQLGFNTATQSRSAQIDPCFRVLFHAPLAMALSPDERFMYVSDKQNGFIRRVDLTSTSPNPVDPHFRLVGYTTLVALQTVAGENTADHFLVASMEGNIVRKLLVRADSSVSTDMTLNVASSSNFTTLTAFSIRFSHPTQLSDIATKQAGLEIYLLGSVSATNQLWQLPLSGPSMLLNRTVLCSHTNGTAADNFDSSSRSASADNSNSTSSNSGVVDENVDFFDSNNSTDTFTSNSTVGNSTNPQGDDGDSEDESIELTDTASQVIYAQYPDNCCSYAFHTSSLPTYSLPAIVGVSSTASSVLTRRNDYLMRRGSDPQAVHCVALGAYVWSTPSSTYESQYVDATNGHSFAYKDFFTVSPDGTRVMVSAMHPQHAAMRSYLLSGTLLRLNVSCTLVNQKHYSSSSASVFNQPCVQVYLGNRFQIQSRVLRTRQCGKTKSWYAPSFHRRLLEAERSEAFAFSSDRMALCPNGLPSWATCVVDNSKGFTQIPAARVALSLKLSDQCLNSVSGRSLANITFGTQFQLAGSLGVEMQRIAVQQMQVVRHTQMNRMGRAAAATDSSASTNSTALVELQFQVVFLPSNNTSDVDPSSLVQSLVTSLDDSDSFGSSATNPFAAPALISGAASYGTIDSVPVQACQADQAASVNGFNSAVDCTAADGASVTFSDPSTAALTVDGNVATDTTSIVTSDAGTHNRTRAWLIPTMVVLSLLAACLVILAVVYFLKRASVVSRVVATTRDSTAVTKVAPFPVTPKPEAQSDSSASDSAGTLSSDSGNNTTDTLEMDVPGLSPSRSSHISPSPESPSVNRPTNPLTSFFRSPRTLYQPTTRRLLPLPTPFSANSISTAAVDSESKA